VHGVNGNNAASKLPDIEAVTAGISGDTCNEMLTLDLPDSNENLNPTAKRKGFTSAQLRLNRIIIITVLLLYSVNIAALLASFGSLLLQSAMSLRSHDAVDISALTHFNISHSLMHSSVFTSHTQLEDIYRWNKDILSQVFLETYHS